MLRWLLSAAFAALFLAAVALPLLLRYLRRKDARLLAFARLAQQEGRAVTAYIGHRARRRGVRDLPGAKERLPYSAARYSYYAPDGAKYRTRRYTGSRLPDRFRIFLYPDNPRRYLTEDKVTRGCSRVLPGLLACGCAALAGFAFWHLLGLFY